MVGAIQTHELGKRFTIRSRPARTLGEAAKRRRHKRSLMTSTGLPSGF